MEQQHLNFQFLLKPELSRSLSEYGLIIPNELQMECLPQVSLGSNQLYSLFLQALNGQDILCKSKNSSGKTMFYLLSILQRIQNNTENRNNTAALILCSSKELVFQVKRMLDQFAKYMDDIWIDMLYGGAPVNVQRMSLKKCEGVRIVVGTPGRVEQFVKEGSLKLSGLVSMIVDECDLLFENSNTKNSVSRIIADIPALAQVIMVGTTIGETTKKECLQYMKNPYIHFEDDSTLIHPSVNQFYMQVDAQNKLKLLVDVMDRVDFDQIIIFTNLDSTADEIQKHLLKEAFPVLVSHGKLTSEERQRVFSKLANYESRILVTTSIMERGMNLERVNLVINYDVPSTTNSYIHRIGRVRKEKNMAITFITTPVDRNILQQVEIQSKIPIGIWKLDENRMTLQEITAM